MEFLQFFQIIHLFHHVLFIILRQRVICLNFIKLQVICCLSAINGFSCSLINGTQTCYNLIQQNLAFITQFIETCWDSSITATVFSLSTNCEVQLNFVAFNQIFFLGGKLWECFVYDQSLLSTHLAVCSYNRCSFVLIKCSFYCHFYCHCGSSVYISLASLLSSDEINMG